MSMCMRCQILARELDEARAAQHPYALIKECDDLRKERDNGYLTIGLRKAGECKTWKVHTLVALAFFGPRIGDDEIAHFDGNPQNNHIKNLGYVTKAENTRHANYHKEIVAEKERSAKLVEALKYYAAMRFNREKMEWMPGNPDKAINALAAYKDTAKESTE